LDIIAAAKRGNCELILPTDIVVAREFKAGAENDTVPVEQCPDDAMILDAGPETIARIKECFDAAKTVVWNGPLGAFEIEPFNTATDAAASYAAMLSSKNTLITVAGGGDTVAALNASGSAEKFTYISTAGGAFLEWLEGKTLPGVAALQT
jgi:phosphoglycerate kinase